MNIEIRLKQLLKKNGLDEKGITQRLARDLDVHRHTIGKLYRNQLKNPPLKLLGELCDWLQSKDVKDPLPQSLFGIQPAELWQAVVRPGSLTIYLGECRQELGNAIPANWIARRDATVQTGIVRLLTTRPFNEEKEDQSDPPLAVSAVPGVTAGLLPGVGRADPPVAAPAVPAVATNNLPEEVRPPTVRTEYIPFHVVAAEEEKQTQFLLDTREARAAFKRMRQGGDHSSILIGSQRVNYLLEEVVADTFGCTAFTPVRGQPRVPFYLAYQGRDRLLPSCFGGECNPPGRSGKFEPGIMYLDAAGKWVLCARREDEDAGVVFVLYDKGTQALEIGVFGSSGRATEVVGARLINKSQDFWPPKAHSKGLDVGVYICRFKFEAESNPGGQEVIHLKDVEVIPLDPKILGKYVRKGR